jgi:hypothetical protein
MMEYAPENTYRIQNCTINLCPKEWTKLNKTENPHIRFCDHCQKTVHAVHSEEELLQMAQDQKCVMFVQKKDDEIVRLLGEPRLSDEFWPLK